MSKESTDAQRRRLLGDPQVQTMIRMRAFELYQMRGREPGHEREDWFTAEGEVLEFLIHEEERRNADARASVAGMEESAPASAAQAGLREGGKDSAIGVWSATEPPSAELAPPIGGATESTPQAPAKKARAGAKSSATNKSKSKGEAGGEPKKGASKARSKKSSKKD